MKPKSLPSRHHHAAVTTNRAAPARGRRVPAAPRRTARAWIALASTRSNSTALSTGHRRSRDRRTRRTAAGAELADVCPQTLAEDRDHELAQLGSRWTRSRCAQRVLRDVSDIDVVEAHCSASPDAHPGAAGAARRAAAAHPRGWARRGARRGRVRRAEHPRARPHRARARADRRVHRRAKGLPAIHPRGR